MKALLAGFRRVIVAYSGGVDSTVLAKLARDVLGKTNAPAVTADSSSLAQEDLTDARRIACQLDLDHVVVPTCEVEDPAYRVNATGRCYLCKQALFQMLEAVAQAHGVAVIAYGAIGDDRLEERPGQRAALRYGIRAPLQEVGLAKWEVRALARHLGLPNWDKPQNACLSSRIPHGQQITQEKLRQVEQAESFLRAQGFQQVRVRHLGARARIEVERDSVPRLDALHLKREVEDALRAIGFESVVVDPQGYRPGGANQESD